MKTKFLIDQLYISYFNDEEIDSTFQYISDPLAILMNRLISKYYKGKKIKFLNLYMRTEKNFQKFPTNQNGSVKFAGGHFNTYKLYSIDEFNVDDEEMLKQVVWEHLSIGILEAAEKLDNFSLVDSVNLAHDEGLSLSLNPDFELITEVIEIQQEQFKISIWLLFKDNFWNTKLIVTELLSNDSVYERDLLNFKIGNNIVLDTYKKVLLEGDNLIIRGIKDFGLPIRISITEIIKT